MRIIDLLATDSICLKSELKNREDILDLLIDMQYKKGVLSDKEAYKKEIMEREALSNTAIESGIVIPHAKSNVVKAPSLAVVTLKESIDCEALDGNPSDIFFMIAAPLEGNVHLEILSTLMKLMVNKEFISSLKNAKTPEEFISIISKSEQDKIDEELSVEPKKEGFRVLAVTACPTGIAHTFMAAEALEKAGEKLGIPVKAETNGSGGAKNILTDAEIEAADGIIISADKNVETARFHGKKVLFTPVSEAIHKPEKLINEVLSGNVPVYKHEGGKQAVSTTKESFGRQLYKHLMNGVSHMLPFVIGGGILIALAFLFDDYSINPANFGMNTPLAAYLKTIGGTAFSFMLPILAGYIAYSIADRPGLAVGFVGGAIAGAGNSFVNITADGAISGGFLAALLAGFVGGYIVLGLKKMTEKLPSSLEGIRPILIYPLIGILLIGTFMFAINPFMGAINTGITNFLNSMGGVSKILLGAILGGMMSVDMGGPVNKAAYVFGTASLATGNYEVMAAVMVGGMIPPLVIALSTTFFRNKWTASERKNGMVNYIMGLCFISEGAIPFAAADPLRVLPSCILGSAVAGGLSMFFDCTLRAPHGGIFVFPVVGNVVGYLISLAVGSVVGMLVLSSLKKKVTE